MTTPERLERGLPSILTDLAMGPTPEYLDDVFSQTGRMRQRPAWTFPERWIPMADITTRQAIAPRVPFRMIGVALVIIALIVGAAAVYVGTHQTRLPAPFGPAANGLIPYTSNGDIYLGDPVSGQSRLLASGPDEESGPLTSPDGTKVAFARDVAGVTGTDIWVVGIDGSHLRKITTQPIVGLNWAAWAPAGDRLAIIHDAVDGAGIKTSELDMIDLDDASLRKIAEAYGLSWIQFRPPAGDELLYRALVGGHWGLFSMRADGTPVRTVVPATVPSSMTATFLNATYSADGSRVFFNEYTDGGSSGSPGCCQLFEVNADGTDLHQFVANDGTGTWDGNPMASPDGKWIAFWHNLPDRSTQQLAVAAADGSGKVTLTGPQVAGAQFIWAPDSSRILLYPDGGPSAYLVRPEGGDYSSVPWRSEDQLDWQRVALPD
jgi:Tol biopolymer transport system component